MILSSPILPLRFYTSLFDQVRFNAHCNQKDAPFELVYAANELPSFQIRRDSKFQEPTEFFIRNICKDIELNYYKLFPEGVDKFGPGYADYFGTMPLYEIVSEDPVSGPIYGDRPILTVDCGKMVSVPMDTDCETAALSYINIPLGFNDPYNFTLKIVVDTFYTSGSFAINIKLDGTTVGTITSAGTHIFNLENPDLNPTLKLEFIGYECGDYFSISFMQAIIDKFNALTGEAVLNTNLLSTYPTKEGKDIIVFCNGNSANLSPGQYYYVVASGDDKYFSEVFTIKDAVELDSLYKLTWWNSCDINYSILYNPSTVDCDQFKNFLYLDAGLFKPEYDTKEEGEENGRGDLNTIFQRWQKNLHFDCMCPEFLADALSGVFMHDEIYVRRPKNEFQLVLDNEYKVLRVVPDVKNVADDCFQLVDLKLLLEDNYTDSECCDESPLIDCTPCDYNVALSSEDCDEDNPYYLVGGYNIKRCSDDVALDILPTDIFCINGKYYMFVLNNAGTGYNISKTMPNIDNVTTVGLYYNLFLSVLPYTFARIEYNKDGAGWVQYDEIQADEEGDALYLLPVSLSSGATDFKVRIYMHTLNCDYAYSIEYDII